MDFKEFRNKTLKNGPGKQYLITNSFGIYDIYKWMRRNKWYDIGRAVREKEFYAIIRGINLLLAEEIALGNTVVFPERMGKLEVRKLQKGVSIVNGVLKNTYPINWDKTLRLWYEDAEAHEKKLLVRDPESIVYHVKYCKFTANYENKAFYKFMLNSFIRRKMKENIEQGKLDTLW